MPERRSNMDFPKGYKGPGNQYSFNKDEEHKVKKDVLKKLKKTMSKATADKAAKNQKKELLDSKFVSSVEPTYPGFKGEK